MKPIKGSQLLQFSRLLAGVVSLSSAMNIHATVAYTGVAAGDASSTEAILWNPGGG